MKETGTGKKGDACTDGIGNSAMRGRASVPENRVFSGIQPSGALHLGNYLGALQNFVRLQEDYSCLYCIVDLHAITIWQNPEDLLRRTREVAAGFLASGIDPAKSLIFNQSQVPAHAELGWIFTCIARMGWLNRMTQFKDKAGKHRENASVGLFVYPALMAADILAYRATHVPVGEDQKQHLELTRDLAQKFHSDFAARIADLGFSTTYFPEVQPLIPTVAPRIMSLRDGGVKMSSSDPSDQSRINLLDDADAIAFKLRKARTDPDALPNEVAGLSSRLEAGNLVRIYAALEDSSPEEVLKTYGGSSFSRFKEALTDLVVAKVAPIGAEMRKLLSAPEELDVVLADGAARAREISDPVLQDVKEILGFAGSRGSVCVRDFCP